MYHLCRILVLWMLQRRFSLINLSRQADKSAFAGPSKRTTEEKRSMAGNENSEEVETQPPPKRVKTDGEEKKQPPSQQQSASGWNWKAGLYTYLNNPTDPSVVHVDEIVLAIADKYPKAKCHYLVMPRDTKYKSYQSFTADDVPLLEKLHVVAQELMAKHPDLQFKLGFHAIPSMDHAHLHVISQDFNSPCLKNKKHWNSFTTNFFVEYDELLKCIQSEDGDLSKFRDREVSLKVDLKCHICGTTLKNIPTLKKHIASCKG